MNDPRDWAFPPELQPDPEGTSFDLVGALESVVWMRVEIPEDSFTASILGTERVGNGVVIREDGLVLTIGYLITEAQSIWLTTNAGTVVQGHPIAYDQATGFGLVQPLGALGVRALERGSAASVEVGGRAIIAGHGGLPHALLASIVAKREFAGYWEYVLDEALFTAPPHPAWSGAALLGPDGRVIGIGSLLVQEANDDESVEGNMFVPIDPLEPILKDMLALGRPSGPARPWLGLYATESRGQLLVGALADGGPADRAGVRVGDIVAEVAGERVNGLAELFRAIWRQGHAGADIPLPVVRDGTPRAVRVHSADRNDFLRKPALH